MDTIYKRRKDDIVIVVLHDKIKKDVIVTNINDEGLRVLKYNLEAVLMNSLLNFVSDDTRVVLDDFLKDAISWTNLGEVISKMHVFNLLSSKNEKVRVKVKAFPKESDNHDLLEFELLIRNLAIIDKFIEFKIKNNFFSEALDKKFGVRNYKDNMKELDLMIEFSNQYSIACVMCLLRLQPKEELYNVDDDLKNVISVLRAQIREDDIIGIKDKNDIIFILFDCESKNAREVVERIYDAIRIKINIKLCISYFPIIDKLSLENILNNLENTTKMLLE